MGIYSFIWMIASELCCLSLLLALFLTVRRIITDRMERRRKARRDELLGRLLEYLADPEPGGETEFVLSSGDVRILNEVIEHLFRSVDGDGRIRLVEFLRALDGVDERLATLRKGDEWERTVAASSLRHFGEPRVIAALHEALGDPSPSVRGAVARALVEMDAVTSAKLLIDSLVVQASMPPQAIRDIFRKIAPRFLDELIEVARFGVDSARVIAIDALAHSGELRVVGPLIELLEDCSKEVAANVFRALTLLRDSRALPAVMKGLEHPAWEVRGQAALCAGQINATAAKDVLSRLLDDPVWWVRHSSAQALYDIGEHGRAILRQLGVQPTRAGRAAKLTLAEKATSA